MEKYRSRENKLKRKSIGFKYFTDSCTSSTFTGLKYLKKIARNDYRQGIELLIIFLGEEKKEILDPAFRWHVPSSTRQ